MEFVEFFEFIFLKRANALFDTPLGES